MSDNISINKYNTICIPRWRELRFEVNDTQKYKIKLIKGLCEHKGMELLPNKYYLFTDMRSSIFTYTGCEVEVEGESELSYISELSSYPKLFNIYNNINNINNTNITNNINNSNITNINSSNICNITNNINNSNILLIGNGISTTAITLCNYFIRDNKKVLFTELHPGKGNIFPCTLSTIYVNKLSFNTFDITNSNININSNINSNININNTNTNINLINPYCIFYGSKDIDNYELYDVQINALSKYVGDITTNSDIHNVIIAPYIDNDILNKTIEIFNINRVIVCGDERLYNKLKNINIKNNSNLNNTNNKINNNTNNNLNNDILNNSYFLSMADGYIHNDKINKSIRRYFHGEELVEINNVFQLKEVFSPARITLSNPVVVKVGEDYIAPDTALPLGASRKLGVVGVEEVDLSENAVLALSECGEKEDLATFPVSAFLVCTDEKKGKMLSVQPKLPKNTFIIQSNIKYTTT
ncbi:CLP1 [Ecytonucleospora hepatopenaei]|uniref:Polynucleotide 5'-hydroxyl-kinase GRC3 n=1 Tax=Ecytonucleospora hepatopenaei TaxID=646526 RepID=A0A1W0E5C0_9MICR|nr:CLP1 [Ecytonucleospora hepatopenaei]